MKHLTIRNLPAEVSAALEKEKRRRGASLNRTVIDLLGQILGLEPGARRQNGLRRLAGSWSSEELSRFESAIASAEQIDAELWR